MFKRISLIAAMGALISVPALGSNLYSAKLMASGGVGVAGADFNYGALLNPALVASPKNANVVLGISLGSTMEDPDELVLNAEDVEEELDEIDDSTPSDDEVEDIVDLMQDLDGAEAEYEFGSYFQATIPSDQVQVAFFANHQSLMHFSTNIVQSDIDDLEAAAGSSSFDSDSILSEIYVYDVSLYEYGVAFGKSFGSDAAKFSLGAAPKFQRVVIYDYSATLDRYDDDDINDRDNRSDDSNINLDIGATLALNESLSLGVVAKNLNEEEFETEDGAIFDMETRTTAGVGFVSGGNSFEMDADLYKAKDLVTQQDTQIVRFGTELDVVSWAKLRFGIRHDLEDVKEDTFTFGFGLKPWGPVSMDIAGILGEDNVYGGAVQINVGL